MNMKALFGAFVALLLSTGAHAQTTAVLEARVALGASHYLHSDLGYTAPALLVSVRAGRGAFAIEPEFAIASHESTEKFNIATSMTSNDRFQSAAVNFIGRGHGAMSAYGGGGLGMYWERYRYRLDDSAHSYARSRTQGPRLGAQVVGGVDFTITPRGKAFGQARYEIRSFDDPGGGSVVQAFGVWCSSSNESGENGAPSCLRDLSCLVKSDASVS